MFLASLQDFNQNHLLKFQENGLDCEWRRGSSETVMDLTMEAWFVRNGNGLDCSWRRGSSETVTDLTANGDMIRQKR